MLRIYFWKSRTIFLGFAILASGCAGRARVITNLLPEQVIVTQDVGTDSADETILKAHGAAQEACQSRGRNLAIQLDTTCINTHMFLRYCMTYQYVFDCLSAPDQR